MITRAASRPGANHKAAHKAMEICWKENENMRKGITLFIAVMMTVCMMTACAQPAAPAAHAPTEQPANLEPEPEPVVETPVEEPAGPVELIIFAAASMTESMNTIAQQYHAVAPNVTITYNFDSSGTLKTQIEEGADCDIFISAAQKQMNQLDITAAADMNTDGLDFVLSDTRFNLVGNAVVMIVPEDSDKDITDFMDVFTDKVALCALGNSDVPVGQYSEEIYTSMGKWEELTGSGKVTYGSNVKEVLALVSEGAVDCGIVYSTDAATAKGVKVVASAPEGSHKAITYPAAVMKATANLEAAKAFLDYLKTDECCKVFTDIGFVIPSR